MKKVVAITLLVSLTMGCSPYGMQGNPAAVQAGAAIGGVLGAIIGDRAGGYNGSQFGALIGTVAGAAVGNAVTTPRIDEYADDGYAVDARMTRPYYVEARPMSTIEVMNLRFIDDNRNHVIDAEEDCKLVFDVVNEGEVPAYNVTPIIEEVTGVKHLLISPSQQIAYMPSGDRIRYTATIRGAKKLKTGEAMFRVYASESNGAVSNVREFSLPTQRRVKK